jgi:thiol-disulfide isomerase/thioredoxin
MIGAFIVSMLLSYKDVLASFLPLTTIWIIHLFLPDSKINNVIIYLIFTPLTFLFGYYLKRKLAIFKIIYSITLVFVGLYAFNNLWYVTENYGARKIIKSPKMELVYTNSKIRIDTIQDKVIVLDFWTTNCGVCFEKFPDFEKKYLSYKNNSNVLFYAVNIPIRNDTLGYAKKLIKKYNYKFPKLFATSDTIPRQLDFNKYPHNIILKNGKIRFNGSLSISDKDVFLYKLESEIERLLNE